MRRTLRAATVAAVSLLLVLESSAQSRAFEDLLQLYIKVLDQLQEDLLTAIEAKPDLEPAFATVPRAFPSIKDLLVSVRRWARANRRTDEVTMADKLVYGSGITLAAQQYLMAARDDAVNLPGRARLVGRGARLLLHLAQLLEPLESTKSGMKIASLRVFCQITGSDVQDGGGTTESEKWIKEDLDQGSPEPPLKKVFVTDDAFSRTADSRQWLADGCQGDVLGCADQLCQNAAQSAGLEGTYAAWLSVTAEPFSPAVNAATRVGQGGWVSTCAGNPVVAEDIIELTGGVLQTPILCDQAEKPRSTMVWTGTNRDGIAIRGGTCDNWIPEIINLGSGEVGQSGQTNMEWTEGATANCSNTRLAFYCFEK